MKTVLVTGGTTRLGFAIADRLRVDGWRVITSSHRPEAGADIVADLAEDMGPARLYARALALNGGLPPDALVNNAACFTGDPLVLEKINLVAPQKLTMLMAGRETDRGSVVNILDARILSPDGEDTPYARTKRELLAYTTKAAALFVDTLRVNAVAPGPVLAPTEVHVRADLTPLGRPTPDAVADAVAWLLAASYTTGCVLPVSGYAP